jgi:hypothetical protein
MRVPAGFPQSQAVKTPDYARDIGAVLGQEAFHAATMMHLRFHPATVARPPRFFQIRLRRQRG